MGWMRCRICLALFVYTLGTGIRPVFADDAHDFYRGKIIRVLVGYGPGGGFDAYARILGAHLSRFIAGSPTIIVEHMPGAASMKMANYIYNIGEQDGTILGIPNQALALNALLWHETGGGFDPVKVNWIGRLDYMATVGMALRSSGITRIEDAKRREIVFGGTQSTGSSVIVPLAINKLLGTKIRIIQGYQDASEEYLAMEKGEIQGMGNANYYQMQRVRAAWLDQRKVVILYQESFERNEALPEVPTLLELAQKQEDKQELRLLASGSVLGRAFFTGPRVPASRVEALRAAFVAMTKDATFRADAQKLGILINPLSGEQLQKMIGQLAALPGSLLRQTRRLATPPG